MSTSGASEHSERFDVITSADGSSTLHFRLACATVLEHYQSTTTMHGTRTIHHGSDQGLASDDGTTLCSTGLRVYEGAQVLSAFLHRYGMAFVPLLDGSSTGDTDMTTCTPVRCASEEEEERALHLSSSGSPPRFAVELGCGCGLVGFTLSSLLASLPCSSAASFSTGTAAHVANVKVVFTDASEPCLRLVRRTGADRLTFPLMWNDEGVHALHTMWKHVLRGTPSQATTPRAGLVLGSDIMYYRVDIYALLRTVKQLLIGEVNADDSAADECSGFCLFSHVMRIADGRRKLAQQARALGLGLAEVPLSAFLDVDGVVLARAWGGLEVVVLYVKGKEERAALQNVPTDGMVCGDDGRADTVKANAREALVAAAEVQDVRRRLGERATMWKAALYGVEAGTPERHADFCENVADSPPQVAQLRRAIAQAEALQHAVAPYFSRNGGADTTQTRGWHGQESAEEELLHMLL